MHISSDNAAVKRSCDETVMLSIQTERLNWHVISVTNDLLFFGEQRLQRIQEFIRTREFLFRA